MKQIQMTCHMYSCWLCWISTFKTLVNLVHLLNQWPSLAKKITVGYNRLFNSFINHSITE